MKEQLMIGNYVYSNTIVTEVTITELEYLHANPNSDAIQPISLNGDELLKLGAIHKLPDSYYILLRGGVCLCLMNITTEECYQTEIRTSGPILSKESHWLLLDIKYTHQLQNLYYSLTTTQLKYK